MGVGLCVHTHTHTCARGCGPVTSASYCCLASATTCWCSSFILSIFRSCSRSTSWRFSLRRLLSCRAGGREASCRAEAPAVALAGAVRAGEGQHGGAACPSLQRWTLRDERWGSPQRQREGREKFGMTLPPALALSSMLCLSCSQVWGRSETQPRPAGAEDGAEQEGHREPRDRRPGHGAVRAAWTRLRHAQC